MRVLFLIILVLTGGWWMIKPQETPPPNIKVEPIPTPSYVPYRSQIIFGDHEYKLFLQKIENPSSLLLIPNFSEKKTARQIISEYNCHYGANGGFYTEGHTPLGLFKVSGEFLNESVHNTSFTNGFLYKTTEGILGLTTEVPRFNAQTYREEFIFQSGPLFGPKTFLRIRDDERARRVLVAKTWESEWYFVAITEANNIHSGPFLADVPEIIDYYNNSQPIANNQPLTTLLNMDGGSASAFFGKDGTYLDELVSIGSFLCAK